MFVFVLLIVFSVFCEDVFSPDPVMADNDEYKCELHEGEEMYEGECMLCVLVSPKSDGFVYAWTCLIRIMAKYTDEDLLVDAEKDTLQLVVRKRAIDGAPTGIVSPPEMLEEDELDQDKVYNVANGIGKYDRVIYFPTAEEADVEFKLKLERCQLVVKTADTDEVVEVATEKILGGTIGTVPDDYSDCYLSGICEYGKQLYYEGYRIKICEGYDPEVDALYGVCTPAAEFPGDECVEGIDVLLREDDF